MRVQALTAQDTGCLEQLLSDTVIYLVTDGSQVMEFKDYDDKFTQADKDKLTLKYFTNRIFAFGWNKIPTTKGTFAYWRYHEGRLYISSESGNVCFKAEEIY